MEIKSLDDTPFLAVLVVSLRLLACMSATLRSSLGACASLRSNLPPPTLSNSSFLARHATSTVPTLPTPCVKRYLATETRLRLLLLQPAGARALGVRLNGRPPLPPPWTMPPRPATTPARTTPLPLLPGSLLAPTALATRAGKESPAVSRSLARTNAFYVLSTAASAPILMSPSAAKSAGPMVRLVSLSFPSKPVLVVQSHRTWSNFGFPHSFSPCFFFCGLSCLSRCSRRILLTMACCQSSSRKTKGASNTRDSSSRPVTLNRGKSLLDRTLGLHRTTHFKYIGPSSVHEERILDMVQSLPGQDNDEDAPRYCRVDEVTTFLSRPDSKTLFNLDDEEDLEAIEAIVHPHGPALVDLYFRTVHPSYPILHKGVWLEKHARSFKEFSPPQLASFYLLAMDFWEYDRNLASKDKPDAQALLKFAMETMTAALRRPKLSTVQAGLLFLQISGGDCWVMASQVVALAEELGLHIDCTTWNIPDWEKGLRRRLAWAVYMQDKWSSFLHGRPSHIQSACWRIPQLKLDDFPESAADEDDKDGSTEVEQGRLLFIYLTRLTEITADALETLYGPDQSQNDRIYADHGVQGLLELIKPLSIRLKQWAVDMPPCLKMDDVKPRKLCSNGNLHLSYFITEIMMYRFIIRRLTPDTPPALRDMCREAAKARLEHAIRFVETLRPEHLQAFWWFATAKSLVLVRTYGALLWATSSSEAEGEYYRQKLIDFKWSLRVRSKGVGCVTAALREMEDSLLDVNLDLSPTMTGAGNRVPAANEDASIVGAPSRPPPQPTPVPPHSHLAGTQSPPRAASYDAYPDAQQYGGPANPLDPRLNFGMVDPDAARQMFLHDVNQGMFYSDLPPQ